jgi:uncharacterized protein
MNIKILIFLVLFIIIILIAGLYYLNNPLGPKAVINGQIVYLEIAASPEEKQRGLSYRDKLAFDHGMLFIYDHKERFGFWMNEMRFPLDFIWIDGNTVVDLSKNVLIQTNGKTTTLQPIVSVDRILEVNAGYIQKNNIKIGDKITFITK